MTIKFTERKIKEIINSINKTGKFLVTAETKTWQIAYELPFLEMTSPSIFNTQKFELRKGYQAVYTDQLVQDVFVELS